MRFAILFAILLFSSLCLAQTAAFYQLPQPLPNANVRVCPVQTQNPCPSPSAIFSDLGLTQPLQNPYPVGRDGNFGFWVAPGQYVLQIASPYNLVYTISLGGGGGGGGCVANPADGGCALAGSPSIDNFIGSVGVGTGWITQLLNNQYNVKVPINVSNPNSGNYNGVFTLGCAGNDPPLGSGISIVGTNPCTPYKFYPPPTPSSGFLVCSYSAPALTCVWQQFVDLTQNVGTTILPVANGGCGSSTASGCLVNILPTAIRNGDIIYWNGSAWNNFGGNTTTPAFLTENGAGAPGWVAVPIPPVDGGTGLTTLTLNTFYKGNTTAGMLASQLVEDSAKLASGLPIKVPAGLFSALASCVSGIEGEHAAVTDSTTAVWGATITGSGANHVLAYCDGTNWTVAAK